jgi:hypothetical protein
VYPLGLIDNSLEEKKIVNTPLEASLFNKRIKNILIYGSSVASVVGTGLAIKNELGVSKLGGIQKELEENKILLETTITNLNKINSELEEAEYKKYGVNILNIRIDNHFTTLQNSSKSLLNKALELQEIINNPNLSVTEKIKIMRDFDTASFLFKRDLGEFKKLTESLSINVDCSSEGGPLTLRGGGNSISTSSNGTSSQRLEEEEEEEEIKKSNIIDWDSFENLNSWEKLAISLLLTKSVVFSSLIGIIFIYYGDILLNKYNLESKYPKLANIIKLRRKFSRYYFIVDCLLIFGVVILEVALSVFILIIMNTDI